MYNDVNHFRLSYTLPSSGASNLSTNKPGLGAHAGQDASSTVYNFKPKDF